MKKLFPYWILLLLIVNIWILIHRNEGYRYYPYKTYNELYTHDSMFYLKDVDIRDSIATLHFSLPVASYYSFFTDSVRSSGIITAINNSISFTLQKGIHLYSLDPVDTTVMRVRVKIDHDLSVNEFIYSNLPGPRIKVADANTWSLPADAFLPEECDSAINILKKHTNFFTVDTDFDKAKELSKFIASLPNNPKGISQVELSHYSALRQLQEALKGNADLACGNYTAIYHYLATAAGLTTRVVTFSGGTSSWNYGIHYYNEVYFKQVQQWALADPLYNIYFPFDENNRYYNAADLKKMVAVNGFGGKKVYTFKGDSTILREYDTVKAGHVYYHSSNADMCYLHPNVNMRPSAIMKFMDFYSFEKEFSYYSDTKSNNWRKIIIKTLAVISLIISIVIYAIIKILNRQKI